MRKKKIPGIIFPVALSLLTLVFTASPAIEFCLSSAPQNPNEAFNTFYLFLLSDVLVYAGFFIVAVIWVIFFLIHRKNKPHRGKDWS